MDLGNVARSWRVDPLRVERSAHGAHAADDGKGRTRTTLLRRQNDPPCGSTNLGVFV